ncbi:NUDIX domain-containing protein [Streptomyces sp. NPDC057287]|uniref:NUDIX domain-containing protein n=1 Tax=Streptomyces sp. NPDC057287 TaxID=3346086 RepID=UPI00363D81E4
MTAHRTHIGLPVSQFDAARQTLGNSDPVSFAGTRARDRHNHQLTRRFRPASVQESGNLRASPGGHVDIWETSLAGAARELEEEEEEAGIAVLSADLRQVGAFDAPGRDPRGRYVSVAYTATLPATVTPTAGDDATAARWWPLDALPDLAFDHAEILAAAVSLM